MKQKTQYGALAIDCSQIAVCRECSRPEGENADSRFGRLLNPCACSKPVHRSCLDGVRQRNALDFYRCRECRNPYGVLVQRQREAGTWCFSRLAGSLAEKDLVAFICWQAAVLVGALILRACDTQSTMRDTEQNWFHALDSGWCVYYAVATLAVCSLTAVYVTCCGRYLLDSPAHGLRELCLTCVVCIAIGFCIHRLTAVFAFGCLWQRLVQKTLGYTRTMDEIKRLPVAERG